MPRYDVTRTRRSFLKTSAVVGSAGLASTTSLAGCIGSTGGGGGNEEVTMTHFPASGVPRIIMNQIIDEGILQENMNAVGYEPNVNFTFTGSAQLLSGQTQISAADFSALDAAVAAKERDMDFWISGKAISLYHSLVVQTGSEWHPDQTGDIRTSVEKMVEEGGTFGIGGWGGVEVLFLKVMMDEMFGYDFSENGDFTVQTAEYPSMNTLVAQGELDMASTAPTFDPKPYMDGDTEGFLNYCDTALDMGWGLASIGNFISPADWAENNSAAIKALIDSYEEGIQNVLENPLELAQTESGREALGVETNAQAEYLTRWMLPTLDHPLSPGEPPVYTDIRLNETYNSRVGTFLDLAAELGLVETNWSDSIIFKRYQEL